MKGKVIFANMSGSDRDFAWRARGILTHISERVSIFTAAAKQLKIKASANSNSVAWEGAWGYSPLGLIIKLLIWPLHTIISNRFAHHLFS